MSKNRAERVVAPFGGLSLTTKGILVVAIPVCALLTAMAVFYHLERKSQETADWVAHTYRDRGEIRRVLLRLADADGAVHGYLLTGQESFLEAYRRARGEISQPLGELAQLAADNPEQRDRAPQVRTLAFQAFDSMGELLREAGNRRAPDTQALERVQGETDAVRRELDTMAASEDRLLAERTAQAYRADRRTEIAIYGGSAFGLLGGLLAALLFTTGIARRVRHVEEVALRVVRGLPVDHDVQGSDEIARLERTLKSTSERLVAQTEELREAHAGLESRVRERTAQLSAANQKLTEATALNNAVIQSSPLAIWAIDLEGKVSFWNPAAERIFGWMEPEIIGKPVPVIPPDMAEEYQAWLERFRKGESLSGIERRRRKKDGSPIEVVIWTAPLRDAGGNICGTITIDSDLTQHKLLEAQFRQSQKLEAVGRLAGGVAHDFNNLLTVIAGYSELLTAEAQDRPALLDYAREIQYSANRAGALTAQLLAFSRRQISQPRVLDLNEVVRHSMKLLRRVIGEDIEIETHLDAKLGRVKVDPIHVDQVIMNLVVNARDAMAAGGKLTIETANRTLDADYLERHIGVQAGPYCMLAVSDTGMGMDAETRSRLFEPFFTTKEAGKGTGLGLSIVYGIVKQSNGEIMVYSEPGQGTTFKIYFPMVEVPEELPAPEVRASEFRGTETILLCEDDEAIRRLVHAMLSKQGYRVMDTSTPEEALQVSKQAGGPIQLLLTDIVMPRTSGFELMNAMRQTRPDLKVLYMSGYTDNQVSRSWAIEPDTPFIQKPFTAAALTQKVREALGGSAATSPSAPPSPSRS
jgi:two-component system cell cycle sensor histidine kinase/response regulator CckA